MDDTIVLYTEFNGWELETWHHIYYCSHDVRNQVVWLNSICELLNNELYERSLSHQTQIPLYFQHLLHVRPNQVPGTYRSRYSVSVMNEADANRFKFPITGYNESKRSHYDEPILPIYNKLKEAIKSECLIESKKIINTKFNEIFGIFYKKFTV